MKKFLITLLLAVPALYAMQEGQMATQTDIDSCLGSLPYDLRKNVTPSKNLDNASQVALIESMLSKPHLDGFKECIAQKESQQPRSILEKRGAGASINIPNIRPYVKPALQVQAPTPSEKEIQETL